MTKAVLVKLKLNFTAPYNWALKSLAKDEPQLGISLLTCESILNFRKTNHSTPLLAAKVVCVSEVE